MPPRIPATDDDLDARREFLDVIAHDEDRRDTWRSRAACAGAIGVADSTLSQWISGQREVEWHVVRAIGRKACRLFPGAVPRLVAALAWHFLGVRGRWTPEGEEPVGPYAEESQDVIDALTELRAAHRSGDPDRIARARTNLIEQAEQAARAAGSA